MKSTKAATALVTGTLVLTALSCVRTIEDVSHERVMAERAPGEFLRCDTTGVAARPDTQVIGPAGGRLASGRSEITIPANAIPEPHRIIFSLSSGDTVGVEVNAGRPLDFEGNRSARIQIDMRHCVAGLVEERPWSVWRINRQNLSQSDQLWAIITPVRAIVHVDSISSFMIAH